MSQKFLVFVLAIGTCHAGIVTVTIDSILPVPGSTVNLLGTVLQISGHVTNIDTNIEYEAGFGASWNCGLCPAALSLDPAAAFMNHSGGTGLAVGAQYSGPLLDITGITKPMFLLSSDISYAPFLVSQPMSQDFTLTSNLTVNPAPEPNTVILIALGFAAGFLRRNRRNLTPALTVPHRDG